MTQRISRYLLQDTISTVIDDPAVSFWRGHDEVLDREVSIRLLRSDDPRAAAFLGAARAAALVDDRRLIRILDVLDVSETTSSPGQIAVVSEWVRGTSLERVMRERNWQPIELEQAIAIVDDVARAIAAGAATNVSHGRLRAASVIVTDAHEVRVRGLAVDAALFGGLTPELSKEQADVDGLGCLLYLMVTGMWPGTEIGLPSAPRSGDHVLPPSRVVANVPRAIDDIIARSVHDAARPRGLTNITDIASFLPLLGLARDQIAPTATTTSTPLTPVRRATRAGLRLGAAVLGIALAIGIGYIGWQLAVGGPSAWGDNPTDAGEQMLIASAAPTPSSAGIEQVLPIIAAQSFDPLGDDNGNGKPDGRKGRENEDTVEYVIDGKSDTAWTSDRYKSADLDTKGGVGVILDLGQSKSVRSVSLAFDGVGTAAEVRIADKKYKDPGTWNLLTSAPAGGSNIVLRGARPLVGRYVLLWFPEAPELSDRPGSFQVALRDVTVTG